MYEDSSERWSPVQSVEKILLSVLSMLGGNVFLIISNLPTSILTLYKLFVEPNDESGANIEASKIWRTNREEYNRIVRDCVKKGLGL